MHILIVAATELEIKDLRPLFTTNSNVDFLVTGVGSPNTILTLSTYLHSSKNYDLILNIGVAGSYRYDISLGDVFQIERDRFGDLGAEDKDGTLLDLDDLNLQDGKNDSVFSATHTFKDIASIDAVTVNKAHGSASSIVRIQKKYQPSSESLEGAAFFMTCKSFNVPRYAQLRSISNYVEPRNKNKWNIPLALNELHTIVYELVNNTFVA